MTPKPAPKRKSRSWRSVGVRAFVYQAIAVGLIVLGIWFLAGNTVHNMQVRGIQSGFDFLLSPAGFDIGESLYAFDSSHAYWRAFGVGLTNTLRVAVIGIILTTILGTLLGVGRFSRNALVRGLCYAYVELFRNVPILLQLFMWYLLLAELLPAAAQAWQFGPMFLSKGGLSFPIPVWQSGHLWGASGLLAGVCVALVYRRWVYLRFEATGHLGSVFWIPLMIVLTMGLAGWSAGGAPAQFNAPIQGDFSIENGGSLTPEFISVLLGLTLYTSAFVAEVIRAGILSVPQGQGEAAKSLGLSQAQSTRLVTLPQALRVIIPPMTNQFLNLTKNSSLAVAIGYPDVVSIATTSLNQTGRAVECISIVMLVYLTTSLTTSIGMNWYNARAAIKEH